VTLAVVRDLRELRPPAGPDELAQLETGVVGPELPSWPEPQGVAGR
jgi:hypothetical protein